MNQKQLLLTALRALQQHKFRTVLTTLGIIIGVIAIIAVMSIGEGAKERVNNEIKKLGNNFLLTLGGSPKRLGTRSGGGNLTLKPSDLRAIQEECPDILYVSPGVQLNSKVSHEANTWQTFVIGTSHNYVNIREWKCARGDYFTEQDVRSANRVVVLGKTVAKELFGPQDPIGKIIRIKKLPFKIIGILQTLGKRPDGRDEDDAIFAPVTTIQKKLMSTSNYSAFVMTAKTKERLARASSQVQAILRQQHRIRENEENDFTIFTQDDISQATQAASAVLNILLMIIASISLLVGGIGIMNIMLVTVTERTKEIGIRMALGATTSNLLNQFLIEATTICLLGGIIGGLLGISVAELVGVLLGWPIVISQRAIIISLTSTILIGLFFGYYPAHKAANLNPVEALIER